jgi:hypothetical protein
MMASATGKMAIAAPFALPDAATHKAKTTIICGAHNLYRMQNVLTERLLRATLTTYQTECIYKRARQWRSQHKKLLKKVRKYKELVVAVHDNIFSSLYFRTIFFLE